MDIKVWSRVFLTSPSDYIIGCYTFMERCLGCQRWTKVVSSSFYEKIILKPVSLVRKITKKPLHFYLFNVYFTFQVCCFTCGINHLLYCCLCNSRSTIYLVQSHWLWLWSKYLLSCHDNDSFTFIWHHCATSSCKHFFFFFFKKIVIWLISKVYLPKLTTGEW